MAWKDQGELFVRYKKNPILTVEDWPYQAHSVFNPAVVMVNSTTLLTGARRRSQGLFSFNSSQEQKRN